MIFSCCRSADAVATKTDDAKTKEKVEVAPKDAAAETERPPPQIFAIMRNGHEVIRDAMASIEETLNGGDSSGAKKMWEDLRRWEKVHKAMEEGNGTSTTPKGFFRVLDERCEKIATEKGLFDAHESLDKLEATATEAFEKESDEVKEAFVAFKTANLDHLKKEEDVMMPKVQELKKAGAPMKKIMREEILAVVWDSPDFQFFVEYATKTLAAREKNQAVRVFTQALWAAATENEWKKWNEWVKSSVSPELYGELEPFFKKED